MRQLSPIRMPIVDFHHNVFYYYRGPKTEGRTREQQLENNTTKALINVLENASGQVTGPFLEWLGIQTAEKPAFSLQRPPLPPAILRRKSRRLLLAIVPKRASFSPEGHESGVLGGSRPDAWIVGSDFVVAIESKVAGVLDERQMQRHFAELFGEDSPTYRQIEWRDVHRHCLSLASHLQGLDGWLLQQFSEYLEVIGMSEFCGFGNDFFDYFFTHDDQTARNWVRQTIEGFAEEIRRELHSRISFYEAFDIGNLKASDTCCWAAFGPKDRQESKDQGAYRRMAHQTIVADSQGLQVFVNVECRPAIEKLRERIRTCRSEWRRLVSGLHSQRAFTLKVEERVKKQVQEYLTKPLCTVESACLSHLSLADSSFAYVETLLQPEKVHLPYFTLGTRLAREEVVEESATDYGRKLIEGVTSIMVGLHPLVEFINGQ